MTITTYLRVSTDTQDTANQQHGITEYCQAHGIEPDAVIEDSVSGRVSWRSRKIGALLSNADKGDVLLVAEVSRLARSTLQVLEILQMAAEKKVSIIVVKNGLHFDNSMQAKITAMQTAFLRYSSNSSISNGSKVSTEAGAIHTHDAPRGRSPPSPPW